VSVSLDEVYSAAGIEAPPTPPIRAAARGGYSLWEKRWWPTVEPEFGGGAIDPSLGGLTSLCRVSLRSGRSRWISTSRADIVQAAAFLKEHERD